MCCNEVDVAGAKDLDGCECMLALQKRAGKHESAENDARCCEVVRSSPISFAAAGVRGRD